MRVGASLLWLVQVVSTKSTHVGCALVGCDKLYDSQGNQVIAMNAAYVVCFYNPMSVVCSSVCLSASPFSLCPSDCLFSLFLSAFLCVCVCICV